MKRTGERTGWDTRLFFYLLKTTEHRKCVVLSQLTAMILSALLLVGFTYKEKKEFKRLEDALNGLKPESALTISCNAGDISCVIPSTRGRKEWGCWVGHDVNGDGRDDSQDAVYGEDAKRLLKECFK